MSGSKGHTNGRMPKDVPIGSIKARSYNPATRVDIGIGKLARSMDEIGLLYPVLLDAKNTTIDGHRRVAAAKRLGWKTIKAVVVEGDADAIYGSVNETAKRFTGNELLGLWLKNPKAAPSRIQKACAAAVDVYGRALLARVHAEGYSVWIHRLVKELANHLEDETPETGVTILKWLLDKGTIYQVRKALEAGISPKVLRNAIAKNKRLAMVPAVA